MLLFLETDMEPLAENNAGPGKREASALMMYERPQTCHGPKI